jgi:hypothetical protein
MRKTINLHQRFDRLEARQRTLHGEGAPVLAVVDAVGKPNEQVQAETADVRRRLPLGVRLIVVDE